MRDRNVRVIALRAGLERWVIVVMRSIGSEGIEETSCNVCRKGEIAREVRGRERDRGNWGQKR